ncbi:phage tail tape measure protein [Paenibacillus xylanivorans]|uniref:Phage tail tape measure protein domain-containing protein n=1 Tax=Paenibacillus xylanivorans TaxID=1705561 RepID=A0A0M9BJZ2_9BACL|nr:hypothetical protein [Paenibacillus xylanivorans]KOY12862.1 hypothetical protein AMS66_31255 [Paenibacillus xylanivorans]
MANTEEQKHSLTQEILTDVEQSDIQTADLKDGNRSGIQSLIQRVEEMRDDMQSQMIATLTKDLETFYRGAFNEMKDLPEAGSQELLNSMGNMMKYISSGEARGYSPTMLKESLESSRQMDDQMTKANQNFEIRSSGQTGQTDGIVKDLQRIALQHGMDQEDVGLAYRIGSRSYDNPEEATAFAKEVAKLNSFDNADVEKTATGLEGISSAWEVSGYDLSKVTDMMLKAATISQINIQDLIKAMQQTVPASGERDGEVTKEDALALFMATSSLSLQEKGHSTNGGLAQDQASVGALTEQLKTVDENKASMVPRTETRDNLQFRQSQFRTAFQISTYEAMKGLKEDFSGLQTYLISFLRLIGDQASGISDHMELINRIMEEAGVQVAWDKFADVMNKGEQTRYGMGDTGTVKSESSGGNTSYPIGAADVHRAGVTQERARQQNRLRAQGTRKAEIQTRATAKQEEVFKLHTKRDEQQSLYEQAIQNGNSAASTFHAGERDQAEKEAKAESRELRLLREELDSLDEQIAKTKRNLEFLSRELDENGKAIIQLEHQARMLMLAMDDMDLDAVELRNKLYFLNAEFLYGSTDVQRYESEIQKLRKQSILLNDVLSKLRGEVNALNASFRQGSMDAAAYISKLKELEQAQLATMMNSSGGVLVVPGTGSAGSGSAAKDDKEKDDSANKPFLERHQDFINDAIKDMAQSKIEEVMDFGSGKKKDKPKRRGIKQRFEDMKETGNKKAFFNGNAPIRDKDGKVLRAPDKPDGTLGDIITQRDVTSERKKKGDIPGKLAKLGKFGKSILKPLKAVPYLGMAMTAMDIVSGVVDPLSNMGKSEAEKQSIRASNKEELAKDFKDMEQSSFVGKVWKGVNLGMDAVVKGGISSLFGNNATNNKIGDYWKGFKAVWSENGGDAVEKKLAKEYNYEQEKKESQLQMEKESGKAPEQNTQPQYVQPQIQYIPAAGGMGTIANGYTPQPQSNGIDEMIAKINRQLNKSTSDNETNYQVARSRLLISGVREDSGQMRALMEKYLQENIKFFDKAIASLQKTYDKMAEGKEKDELGLEINEKKQQKAQSELELNGVKNSKIDELRRKMNDQLELTQLDYDKRMYDLLAANGGKEDAPELIALNKSRASELNSQMSSIKQEWQNLLKSGVFKPGSDEYMEIFKQIQSLGVEQSKNLAEISKKMDKPISTFNIPAGLKVMDYFDYMTTNNTHKSVMVGAGDVTVHVNIDNMTGSTKDVEKLTSSLDKTLRQNNPGLVNRMASNVGARMGSNYPVSFIR